MCVPDLTLYTLLGPMLYAIFGHLHTASFQAASELVWALLCSQSLHPSDLARALPSLRTTQARQALRRVRRVIPRAYLSSKYLTPLLIRAALSLLPDAEIILVLDSTRCIRWEIFTLGIKIAGRVLPIAWSIIPYPWPKRQFTPTVLALVKRTVESWPSDRPVHLLADRGFPSLKLFRELDRLRARIPLGYTIRLRASDYVLPADGQLVKIAELIGSITTGTWATWQASYHHRRKAGPSALLVIGRGIPIYPAHQMGPADQARRLAREKRRVDRLLSKGQKRPSDTDRAWALLSTAASWSQAKDHYALRFSTEGTYRDWKSWDLEGVAGHETAEGPLDGLVGLAALGYFIQAAIGVVAGRAVDDQARARQQQWSTTDRLSVFWRGRQVLHDRAHDWRPWLGTTLPDLTRQLAPALSTQWPPGQQAAPQCKEAA